MLVNELEDLSDDDGDRTDDDLGAVPRDMLYSWNRPGDRSKRLTVSRDVRAKLALADEAHGRRRVEGIRDGIHFAASFMNRTPDNSAREIPPGATHIIIAGDFNGQAVQFVGIEDGRIKVQFVGGVRDGTFMFADPVFLRKTDGTADAGLINNVKPVKPVRGKYFRASHKKSSKKV